MFIRSTVLAALATTALAVAACTKTETATPAPAETPVAVATPEPTPIPTPEPAATPTDAAAPAAPDAAATPAAGAEPAAAAPAAPVGSPEFASLPAPFNAANYNDGKMVFIKCRNCHSVIASEGNKVGPNLHGVFTRKAGTAPGFKYSDAMQKHATFQWTGAELEKWLAKPTDYLPGSSMFFPGLKDQKDRDNVIAYVMVESAK